MILKNAGEFGKLVRQKRRALQLTQEELAIRSGVGLRFIIELEGGKPSCQLGKALTVAVEVGLRLEDTSSSSAATTASEDDPLSQIPSF